MAWASVGALFSFNSVTANLSPIVITTSATLQVGRVAVIVIAVNNAVGTDGDSTSITGVTDSAGNTWSKVREWTEAPTAFAAVGTSCAMWWTQATVQLTSGGTITATVSNAGANDATAAVGHIFSVAANAIASVQGSAGNGAAATDPAAMDVATPNAEFLRIRGIALETNNAGAGTVTAGGWASMGMAVANTGSAGSSMKAWTEYLISTGTGASSNPTVHAVDQSSVYAAFLETPGLTAVQSDLSTPWNVSELVASDLSTPWNVSAVVQSDLEVLWTVFMPFYEFLYLRWNVDELVASDLSTPWNVSAIVQSDLSLPWNVSAIVQSDLELLWTVFSDVSSDLSILWNMSELVASDLSVPWSMSEIITSDLSLPWTIYGSVQSDLGLPWSVYQLAGQSLDVVWNVSELVAGDLEALWHIRGLESVASNLSLPWNISANVQSDLQLVWSMSGRVTADLQLYWGLRAARYILNGPPRTVDTGAGPNSVTATPGLNTVSFGQPRGTVSLRGGRRVVTL